jgi:hypothetical protein
VLPILLIAKPRAIKIRAAMPRLRQKCDIGHNPQTKSQLTRLWSGTQDLATPLRDQTGNEKRMAAFRK